MIDLNGFKIYFQSKNMARYKMTNKEFEEALKEYALLGNIISELDIDRKTIRSKIDSEFNHRKIKKYNGETASAEIKDIPTFDYLSGIVETGDYTLEQLYNMGALSINITKFKEATGKKTKDMKQYKRKTGTTSRLNVKVKPEVNKDFIKNIRKMIKYPTQD